MSEPAAQTIQLPKQGDAVEVRAWVDALPKLKLLEHTLVILEFLKSLQEETLSVERRFEILEIIHPEIEYLQVGHCKQCTQIMFPLDQEQLRAYELVRQLLDYAYQGYRKVAAGLSLEEDAPHSEEHVLSRSLSCAMEMLSRQVLMALRLYRSPRPGIWQEIHSLYRFADAKGMLTRRVEHLSDWSAGAAYYRIILTALVSPGNLMFAEIDQIYALFGKWSSALRVRYPEELGDGQFLELAKETYTIDLDSDVPAVYGYDGEDWQQGQLRLLQLDELLSIIEAAVRKLTVKQDLSFAELHERDLLRRLRNGLSQRGSRKEQRAREDRQAEIIGGLSACHYFISAKQDFLPEDDEVKLHESSAMPVPGLSLAPLEHEGWREDETRRKLEEGVIRPRAFGFDSEDQNNDIWSKAEKACVRAKSPLEMAMEKRAEAASGTLREKDSSIGGFGFFCPVDSALKFCVGELVAVRDADSAYRLASIRWLQTLDDGSLDIGCQHIPGTPQAVAVRAVDGRGVALGYQRALQLDNGNLLVPSGLYAAGNILIINRQQTLTAYKLSRLLSATNSYAEFAAEPIEQTADVKRKISESFYALLEKR